MRKLSTEEQTEKIGWRVKKTVIDRFFKMAKQSHLQKFPGQFFEVVFEEWLKTQMERLSGGKGYAHQGHVEPGPGHEGEDRGYQRKAG